MDVLQKLTFVSEAGLILGLEVAGNLFRAPQFAELGPGVGAFGGVPASSAKPAIAAGN